MSPYENREIHKKEAQAKGEKDARNQYRFCIGLLISYTIFIGVILTYETKTSNPSIALLLGLLMSCISILFPYPLYIISRRIQRFFGKKRREEKMKDYKPYIPAPEIETYPGAESIDAFQQQYVWLVPSHQGRSRAKMFLVASIPVVISIIASTRTRYFDGSLFGMGMSLGEAVCISVLIWFGIMKLKPTEKWVTERIRSELLRREQYLCLAALGPYADADTSTGAKEVAIQRCEKSFKTCRAITGVIGEPPSFASRM